MSKEKMHRLREMLCKELDIVADEGKMDQRSVDWTWKLLDCIKDIDKINMHEEGYSSAGYARAGYARDDGSYARGYMNGDSYGDGRWEARGSYDGGYSGRRDSMGRYSRSEAKDSMMQKLHDLEHESRSEREKALIHNIMSEIQTME